MIAMAFPAFIAGRESIVEELKEMGNFRSSPYPDDVLSYKSNRVFEFRTPSQKDGLGTGAPGSSGAKARSMAWQSWTATLRI